MSYLKGSLLKYFTGSSDSSFIHMSFLKVSGTKIIDGEGKEVLLRGAGLGGWMKYVITAYFETLLDDAVVWRTLLLVRAFEFQSPADQLSKGYPGCEHQIREALEGVIGKEKSEFFFDKVRLCVL
jgi:hypothetical protein